MKNFDLKKNIFEDVSEFKKNHIESVIELLLYGSETELLLQKSSMQAQIFELQEKSNINLVVKETKKIHNALKQFAETNSYEDELAIRKDMGKSWLSLESRKAELEIDLYNQLFKELNGLSNKTLPFEKFKFNDLELHKKYIQQDQAIDLKQKNIDFKKLKIENQQGFERYIQKQFEEDFDLEENYHQENLLEQEQTKVQDSNYQSCLELKLQQRKKQRQKTQNEYIENKKLKNKQILEQIQKEDAAKLQSIEEEYKSLLELKKLEDLMKKNNEDYIRATRRYREMLEQTTEKNDLFYWQVEEKQKREELDHDLEQKENLKHEQKNFINYNIM
jgi:hypothetical protein